MYKNKVKNPIYLRFDVNWNSFVLRGSTYILNLRHKTSTRDRNAYSKSRCDSFRILLTKK